MQLALDRGIDTDHAASSEAARTTPSMTAAAS